MVKEHNITQSKVSKIKIYNNRNINHVNLQVVPSCSKSLICCSDNEVMGKVEYYKWPVLRGTVPLKDQELA